MEELCKDLNLIYDDENVIGKTKNIIEMMYRLIKYDIDNVEDLWEKSISISEKQGFIEILMNCIDNGMLMLTETIKIFENPMGGFNYEVV